MENNNRSNRYRNDNRSSSNERQNDLNWDRNYNPGSNDRNRGDDNVYSSDRERDYWNAKNYRINNRMEDRYWNRDSYIYSDYDRNRGDNDAYRNDYNNDNYRNRWNLNDYGRNYNSDYNRNYNNDNNRNYNNEYSNSNEYNNRYGTDYNRNRNDWYGSNYNNDYNRQYKNEGWRDNYRENDRNWWDKTKDEVASWFGDDDAERRRRMDEYRNGQHRGKGPKNYKRSEDRIREDVSDKLSDDSFLDASDIEVEVTGSEVTLNGKVDSRYSKHRAEDLAEDVTGVTHVQNNLRVNESTPQEPVDNSYSTTINKNDNSYSSDNKQKNDKASALV